MPVEPEPTPKKTKPSGEDEREQHEHPLGVVAQAREEQLLLPLRRLLLARGAAAIAAAPSIRASGGACGAAYLSPRVLFSLLVPGLAVDDRLEHSFRRAAEDDGRRGILDRMVGAPRERHDRQVGALAGRQGTHLGRRFAARAPPRAVASRSASTARSASARRSRAACRVHRGAHLLEDVERRSRGGRVRAEADADARRAQVGERRDPAAEQRVRARAVRDRHAALGEQGDLGVVHLDAVRAEQVGPEHRLERPDRAAPGRRLQERRDRRQRAGAVLEPLVLVRALGEVRPDGDAEGEAPVVHLERARVRRMRRDAEPDEARLGERRALLVEAPAPRRPRCRRTPRGRRSRAGRARPRRSRRRRRSCSPRSS